MRPYKVRRSKIDNLGLYAARNIKRGAKIIEYKGKVITRREAEENPKYDNNKAIYLFNLNKNYDLDGDFKFNTARLINHSCNPNCEVTGTGLKVWCMQLRILRKARNFLMIMALASMKILKIIHVNANQKIAVDLLFEKVLGGESRNGKKEIINNWIILI